MTLDRFLEVYAFFWMLTVAVMLVRMHLRKELRNMTPMIDSIIEREDDPIVQAKMRAFVPVVLVTFVIAAGSVWPAYWAMKADTFFRRRPGDDRP